MAFYTTVRDSAGQRTAFAAGPFNAHGDALRMVGPVRTIVNQDFPRESPWCSYGTAQVKFGPLPVGRFNERLGLPAGRILRLSAEVPQGRWVTGDTADPVGYLRRHGTSVEAARMDRRLDHARGT